MADSTSEFHDIPQFPYHSSPRTWLIISGLSATGLRLARRLIEHGDNVALGVPPSTFEEVSTSNPANLDKPFRRHDSELLRQFLLQDLTVTPPKPGSPSPPPSAGANKPPTDADDGQQVPAGIDDSSTTADWHSRFRPLRLDPHSISQCQGAVAQTTQFFGGIDVLVCNSSEVLIGSVEELTGTDKTRALLREQFEVNFFANVNAIKAVVPAMRTRGGGHILVITGITSHLGTPGLGAFCASGWALEGYCDSIAYEIAPFNIRLSIIQPHLETAVLPNRIKAAPLMDQYAPSSHPAPLARNSIGSLLDRIQGLDATQRPISSSASASASATPTTNPDADDSSSRSEKATNGSSAGRGTPRSLGSRDEIVVHESRLVPEEMKDALLEETLFSICAIGGHPNPPQRHIVGMEGVVSVKEKLKTVSIELEDLVATSMAVDLVEGTQE